MSRYVAGFCIALGVWLGGFLAALAPGAPAALALGAFGLLSTLTAAAFRLGTQPSDPTSQTTSAAGPSLSRARGPAATPTSSRR